MHQGADVPRLRVQHVHTIRSPDVDNGHLKRMVIGCPLQASATQGLVLQPGYLHDVLALTIDHTELLRVVQESYDTVLADEQVVDNLSLKILLL